MQKDTGSVEKLFTELAHEAQCIPQLVDLQVDSFTAFEIIWCNSRQIKPTATADEGN